MAYQFHLNFLVPCSRNGVSRSAVVLAVLFHGEASGRRDVNWNGPAVGDQSDMMRYPQPAILSQ